MHSSSPSEAEAENHFGLSLLQAQRPAEAAAHFLKAVNLSPELPEPHVNLATAYLMMGRNGEATALLKKAISLAPQLAMPHVRLGQLSLQQGNTSLAEQHFKRAIDAEPAAPEAYILLAQLYTNQGRAYEADPLLEKVLESNPDDYVALLTMGYRYQDLGKFEESVAAFQRVMVQQPDNADAYFGIVTAKKVRREERHEAERMEAVAARGGLPPNVAERLHYALGKAFDDLGEYEKAMRHIDEAKQIGARYPSPGSTRFDRRWYTNHLAEAQRTFTKSFFEKTGPYANQSELPIFIIGMPRSGTSLLEQILTSHPEIGGVGEINFWTQKSDFALKALLGPEGGRRIAKETAEEYRRVLRTTAPDRAHVCDKSNKNYLHAGLLHALFPNARIINCRRNPLDNCLSMYLTPYKAPPDIAQDRETILFAYENYLQLMNHWRGVLPPDRLIEVDYEELISDREDVTRSIIDFVGLKWDDACLNHERNQRVVKTPSRWQVRQPIYKTSIERWRGYEPWLGAFSKLLPKE